VTRNVVPVGSRGLDDYRLAVPHPFLVKPGEPADLAGRDPADDLGLDHETADTKRVALVERLAELQARLYAEQRRSILLVLQGLDTSGKDGTIRRVFTGLNPSGCHVVSFKAPAGAELQHDYLWRIHAQLPARGMLGAFNRSHYEDIVTTSVLGLIGGAERKRRIRHVRGFERMLVDEGYTLVKVFLNLSRDEQRKRLKARLHDSRKKWKFQLDDLENRARWDAYQHRYDDAITRTSTSWAPWYVVPADHKWASSLAVATLMVDALTAMDPQYPPPSVPLDGITVE
jgi:PPK2 family polyphosphate:nucleotide phosphotransferase